MFDFFNIIPFPIVTESTLTKKGAPIYIERLPYKL